MTVDMNTPLSTSTGLKCEYYENTVLSRDIRIDGNLIDYSNGTVREIYYEDRTRWKNVQVGPIMYDDDVEALLSRKPNAVRNFINSLNSQMKKSELKDDKKKILKVSNDINDNDTCGYNNDLNIIEPVNTINYNIDDDNLSYDFDLSNKINVIDYFKGYDIYMGQSERSLTCSDVILSSTPIVDIQMFTSDVCDSTRDFNYNDDVVNIHNSYRKLRGNNTYNPFKTTKDSFRRSRGDNSSHIQTNEARELLYNVDTTSYYPEVTSIIGLADSSPPEVQYNSLPLADPPKVNPAVSSSNYLSLKSRATPGDRGRGVVIGPQVETSSGLPVADLRELEGEVNREAVCRTTSGGTPSGKTSTGTSSSSRGIKSLDSRGSMESTKKTIFDLLLGKSFLQSLSSLPEGINVSLFDTPRLKVDKCRVNLTSVHIIKCGWVWIQSVVTHKWLPKFAVLFYDLRYTNGNDSLVNRCFNSPTSISSKNDMNSNGFWSIYQIYSSLGNLNEESAATLSSSILPPPLLPSTPSMISTNDLTINKCIPDYSNIYLAILNDEVIDLQNTLMNGDYIEIMQVDIKTIPSTRQIVPSNWLSNLIAKSIGKEPLNLIVIPLIDGFECGFIPLCAAIFENVKLSYKMQCARRYRVGREYDQWMFYLWEYVVRNTPNNDVIQSQSSIEDGHSSIGECFKYIKGILNTLWTRGLNSNQSRGTRNNDGNDDILRSKIIKSISIDCNSSNSGISSTEASSRLDEILDNTDTPHKINFANWINRYGFDDLSIKMNIYSLVNRRL